MPDYILGIDGGGTKCKAVLYCRQQQRVIATGVAGPANIYSNYELACQSIVAAAQAALSNANIDLHLLASIPAAAGLAGVNVPSAHQRLLTWQHPFKQFHITTDLHIACFGAHQATEGAVLIVGTGSCGVYVNEQQSIMHGGHGFLLGDKGSAAWIGHQAVQAILAAEDGLAPNTILTRLLGQRLAVTQATAYIEYFSQAKPSQFAQLAPLVFQAAEQGDDVAKAILVEAGNYLSSLAAKLFTYQPERLSLLGGLSSLITQYMSKAITEQLVEPHGQPEDGAIFFALQQIQLNNNNKSHQK